MKYILEYLKEELFIEPVAGTNIDFEEEFAADDIPIGYRLIFNNKDVDIVVWYADYNKWLANKYEILKNQPVKEPCLQDLMNDSEKKKYKEFCDKHRKCCGHYSTTGGGISVIVTGTGLGYCFECKCNECLETKDITDSDSW